MFRLIKTIASLLGGITIGLLFAKKSGVALRKTLKNKDNESKAKMIGSELLSVGKDISHDIVYTLKELPKNQHVKELIKLGKTKLSDLIEQGKQSSNQALKEYIPTLETALKKIGSNIKSQATNKIKSLKKIIKK